jgi:hypothetical protein
MAEKRNGYMVLVGKPDVAQDRDQWKALVNTAMDIRIP